MISNAKHAAEIASLERQLLENDDYIRDLERQLEPPVIPVPVVIERYGPQMTEAEVNSALAGQHSGAASRATVAILADFIAADRQMSEDPLISPEQRTFYCGRAASLGDFLGVYQDKTAIQG